MATGLPTSSPAYALYRHPAKGQNLFYALFLVLSPLLSLGVNIYAFQDFRVVSNGGVHQYGLLSYFSGLSGGVLGLILILLGVNIFFALLRRHYRIRNLLLLFGIFSSFYLAVDLCTVAYGIFAFSVQSVALLLVSVSIYISLNIVFLFWYWYLDYPDQVIQLHHPEHPVQISFPARPANDRAPWVPGILDYLYLTVMISNTLGPPENHSAVGARVKMLQILHSTTMLMLLVVVVSRAINIAS